MKVMTMVLRFVVATNVVLAEDFYTKKQCESIPGLGMSVPPNCDSYKTHNITNNVIHKGKNISKNSKTASNTSIEKKCISLISDICNEFKYFKKFRRERLFHDYGFSGIPIAKKYSD